MVPKSAAVAILITFHVALHTTAKPDDSLQLGTSRSLYPETSEETWEDGGATPFDMWPTGPGDDFDRPKNFVMIASAKQTCKSVQVARGRYDDVLMCSTCRWSSDCHNRGCRACSGHEFPIIGPIGIGYPGFCTSVGRSSNSWYSWSSEDDYQ